MRGNTAGVSEVSFSPDGRRLAAPGAGRQVGTAATGQPVLTLSGQAELGPCVAFWPPRARMPRPLARTSSLGRTPLKPGAADDSRRAQTSRIPLRTALGNLRSPRPYSRQTLLDPRSPAGPWIWRRPTRTCWIPRGRAPWSNGLYERRCFGRRSARASAPTDAQRADAAADAGPRRSGSGVLVRLNEGSWSRTPAELLNRRNIAGPEAGRGPPASSSRTMAPSSTPWRRPVRLGHYREAVANPDQV